MPKPRAHGSFYTAHETAQQAGISKATLLRWIRDGRIRDAARRDRNDWRLFTEQEVNAIRRAAQSTTEKKT